MARKRCKPQEIVSLLRQAEVLHRQGTSMADTIRQFGISEVAFYRWRKEYAGMSGDQLRRLKELEKDSERLRHAVWNPTTGPWRFPIRSWTWSSVTTISGPTMPLPVSAKLKTASAPVRAVATESRSASPPTSLPRTILTARARLPSPTPAGAWSNVVAAGSIRQNGQTEYMTRLELLEALS